ncbi:hypothetical protein K1719_046218 [Acacia pycnantha]|nr:hypothetical protein K1719_046218 [Acacia pycnantha]
MNPLTLVKRFRISIPKKLLWASATRLPGTPIFDERAANTGWGAPEDMELERRDRRRREDTSLRKPNNDEFEPRTRDSDRWEEKRHKRQYDYGNR